MAQTITVGIDLGTCNSCIATVVRNRVKIIETKYGKVTPSVVSFDPINRNETVTVGELDKRNISNCIFDTKRFIGKLFNDKIVQKIRSNYPFKIEENDEELVFQIEQRRQNVFKTPIEICAEILKYLKDCAIGDFGEQQLTEEEITVEAVITIPAYYSVSQKDATMIAAKLAGIKVLQLMPEPTAAAVEYCSTVPEAELGLYLVFDLGGGTFDISCIDIRHNEINVKFIDGDNSLGGVNFDEEIVKYFRNKFLTQRQVELDDTQLFKLKFVAKYLKENLSTTDYSKKIVDDFLEISSEEKFELTRDTFEELNKHLFERCMYIVRSAFDRNEVDKNMIKRVILVGGSTKIKRIRQLLTEFFGEEKIYDKLNPDECVVGGAALNASKLRFNDDGKVFPKETFEKIEYLNPEVKNSEESILPLHSLNIINVFPMDISVDSSFNYCDVVIPKNSPLPIEKTYVWRTCRNEQDSIEVSIYEGSYKNSEANTCLTNFNFSSLPKAGAGKVKINATFQLDQNGILDIEIFIENSDNIQTYAVDLHFDHSHCGNQIIDWNWEKDEEFEGLAILKKMYYYLVQRLVGEGVIETVPIIIISDILKDKSATDILNSIEQFYRENSNVNSRYMQILIEVYNIYLRNCKIEDKRQKLIEVKSIDEN